VKYRLFDKCEITLQTTKEGKSLKMTCIYAVIKIMCEKNNTFETSFLLHIWRTVLRFTRGGCDLPPLFCLKFNLNFILVCADSHYSYFNIQLEFSIFIYCPMLFIYVLLMQFIFILLINSPIILSHLVVKCSILNFFCLQISQKYKFTSILAWNQRAYLFSILDILTNKKFCFTSENENAFKNIWSC
jgi:hypothetical protein